LIASITNPSPRLKFFHGQALSRRGARSDGRLHHRFAYLHFAFQTLGQRQDFIWSLEMAPYGQVVIGPPGAGKSTYCNGMNQFLNSIGRNSLIINLDPANDRLPYDCTLDIRDVITLEEIMNDEDLKLGPNGGLMHCLEIFQESIDFFIEKIRELIKLSMDGNSAYVIFDCPGQTELFTVSPIFKEIFLKLVKELDFRLCVVSLVDSMNLTIPSHWISSLLLTLRSMLQLDLPQINVVSKIDLLSGYVQSDKMNRAEQKKRQRSTSTDEDHGDDDFEGGLPFKLQYYTEVDDLHYLTPYIKNENNQRSNAWFNEKYSKLTEAISDLIDDFGLISYNVLAIEDKTSMINLLSLIDKANGYCFGTNELGGDSIWTDAIRQSGMGFMEDIDIQERWIDEKDRWDELENEKHKELIEYYKQQGKQLDEETEWEESLRQWESNNKKEIKK
jgi:GTPase SAR1 family protein